MNSMFYRSDRHEKEFSHIDLDRPAPVIIFPGDNAQLCEFIKENKFNWFATALRYNRACFFVQDAAGRVKSILTSFLTLAIVALSLRESTAYSKQTKAVSLHNIYSGLRKLREIIIMAARFMSEAVFEMLVHDEFIDREIAKLKVDPLFARDAHRLLPIHWQNIAEARAMSRAHFGSDRLPLFRKLEEKEASRALRERGLSFCKIAAYAEYLREHWSAEIGRTPLTYLVNANPASLALIEKHIRAIWELERIAELKRMRDEIETELATLTCLKAA